MRRLLSAGLLLGLAVSGCSTTEEGQPRPTGSSAPSTASPPASTSSPSQGSTELPGNGAPKVENPVEAARFEQEPCLVFTQAQVSELGLKYPGREREAPLGKACGWQNDDAGLVEVLWASEEGRGLTAVYGANKAGKYAYFEPVPDIEGLPGVAYDAEDQRNRGRCTVSVGISDETAFNVSLSQSASKVGTVEPCSLAVQVAAKAVKTIKGES